MTAVEPVHLPELDSRGVLRSLDDGQVRMLRVSRLVKLDRESGGWRIRPSGRVGAVRAGDLDVQVHPKVGIVRLLFFLGYAADPRFRPEDVAGAGEADLWPALAESLIRQVERALAGVGAAGLHLGGRRAAVDPGPGALRRPVRPPIRDANSAGGAIR